MGDSYPMFRVRDPHDQDQQQRLPGILRNSLFPSIKTSMNQCMNERMRGREE